MEKRIFAAVLISIGLLWLWATVAPKLFPELAESPPASADKGLNRQALAALAAAP